MDLIGIALAAGAGLTAGLLTRAAARKGRWGHLWVLVLGGLLTVDAVGASTDVPVGAAGFGLAAGGATLGIATAVAWFTALALSAARRAR
jgi:hypothetical protein